MWQCCPTSTGGQTPPLSLTLASLLGHHKALGTLNALAIPWTPHPSHPRHSLLVHPMHAWTKRERRWNACSQHSEAPPPSLWPHFSSSQLPGLISPPTRSFDSILRHFLLPLPCPTPRPSGLCCRPARAVPNTSSERIKTVFSKKVRLLAREKAAPSSQISASLDGMAWEGSCVAGDGCKTSNEASGMMKHNVVVGAWAKARWSSVWRLVETRERAGGHEISALLLGPCVPGADTHVRAPSWLA